MTLRLLLAAVVLFLAAGCLEPQVDDDVVRVDEILPVGSQVPSIATNPLLLTRLDQNDFVNGDLVELQTGFVDGQPMKYWDFGTSPTFTQPLYMLVRAEADGMFDTPEGSFSPVGHPPVWNVIPGDPAYSPLWLVILVPVTDTYNGEVLPSFDAVQQAQKAGLLGDDIELPLVVNCPVVTPTTRLEMPSGERVPPLTAYYRGVAVHYFDVGLVDIDEDGQVPAGNRYTLRRQGGEPLDEALRQVDLTGDADQLDSNNIFAMPAGYDTDLFVSNEIVVHEDYASIDTSGDETVADFTAATDLFDGDIARPERVVAVYPGTEICNCPLAP